MKAVFAAFLLLGCTEESPPRPQALVFVDTDVPSPRIVDRVRITVLAERGGELVPACDGCDREVAIAAETDWPLSFGIEPPLDSERSAVSAVAFLSGRTHLGEILPETAIASTGFIRFDESITRQEILLSGSCAGIRGGDDVTCRDGALGPIELASERGVDVPSRVGTFRAEHARSCGTAPPSSGAHDEAACVRGGTYWMGDVRRQGFGGHVDTVPEHLVTVSPFFLDRYEYTVGRYRAALASGFTSPSRPATGEGCTFVGASDPSADELPLVCVTSYLADELCAHEGRRLPTEAEREWAAGALEEERLFPWGSRLMAVESEVQGPVPVGSRDWDVVTIDDEPIYDLGWNVVEWVADFHQTYLDPCWAPGGYGADPHCDPPPEEPTNGRSARGGYWRGPGDVAATYRPMVPHRQAFGASGQGNFVGFRCASDG